MYTDIAVELFKDLRIAEQVGALECSNDAEMEALIMLLGFSTGDVDAKTHLLLADKYIRSKDLVLHKVEENGIWAPCELNNFELFRIVTGVITECWRSLKPEVRGQLPEPPIPNFDEHSLSICRSHVPTVDMNHPDFICYQIQQGPLMYRNLITGEERPLEATDYCTKFVKLTEVPDPARDPAPLFRRYEIQCRQSLDIQMVLGYLLTGQTPKDSCIVIRPTGEMLHLRANGQAVSQFMDIVYSISGRYCSFRFLRSDRQLTQQWSSGTRVAIVTAQQAKESDIFHHLENLEGRQTKVVIDDEDYTGHIGGKLASGRHIIVYAEAFSNDQRRQLYEMESNIFFWALEGAKRWYATYCPQGFQS